AGPVGITQLRPAGEPGLDAVSLHVIRDALGELAHELRPLRTRADEAHLPPQHVEDLRQLIDAGLAHEGAHPRDARIALRRPLRLSVLLRIDAHAAELQQLEFPPEQAYPALAVEDRRAPAVPELDGERGEQHDRQAEHEHHEARGQIEPAGADSPQRIAAESLTED